MKLGAEQVAATHRNLDTTSRKFMYPEAMSNILTQSKDDFPDFFLVFKIGDASDTMADRFNWGNKILMHHPGGIGAIGVSPKSKTIYTKPPSQIFWICVGHITYGRRNISTHFFSKLNGQVFILSTNEEINSDHVQIMKERIAATYTLENSDNKRTVVVRNAYFEV